MTPATLLADTRRNDQAALFRFGRFSLAIQVGMLWTVGPPTNVARRLFTAHTQLGHQAEVCNNRLLDCIRPFQNTKFSRYDASSQSEGARGNGGS
jgi:hypothetical protein